MIDAENRSPEPDDTKLESAEDVDPGNRLPELAGLSSATSQGFEAGIIKRMQRRLTAGEVVEAPAGIVASVMQSYITELMQAVHEIGASNGRSSSSPELNKDQTTSHPIQD